MAVDIAISEAFAWLPPGKLDEMVERIHAMLDSEEALAREGARRGIAVDGESRDATIAALARSLRLTRAYLATIPATGEMAQMMQQDKIIVEMLLEELEADARVDFAAIDPARLDDVAESPAASAADEGVSGARAALAERREVRTFHPPSPMEDSSSAANARRSRRPQPHPERYSAVHNRLAARSRLIFDRLEAAQRRQVNEEEEQLYAMERQRLNRLRSVACRADEIAAWCRTQISARGAAAVPPSPRRPSATAADLLASYKATWPRAEFADPEDDGIEDEPQPMRKAKRASRPTGRRGGGGGMPHGGGSASDGDASDDGASSSSSASALHDRHVQLADRVEIIPG